jgi:hypothetical protein
MAAVGLSGAGVALSGFWSEWSEFQSELREKQRYAGATANGWCLVGDGPRVAIVQLTKRRTTRSTRETASKA